MKTVEIKGTLREKVGKAETKKLRKNGNVPCVLYGDNTIVHFYVFEKDFKPLVYTPLIQLVKLDVSGTVYDAIMQDIQFHPVSGGILHMDFLLIHEDKAVTIDVPVYTEGFSKGVQEGGKLKIEARKLKVSGLMKNLPDNLLLDVSDIALGKTIKVGDLKYDNFEILNPKSLVVVSVKLTRVARGMAAATLAGGADGSEQAGKA